MKPSTFLTAGEAARATDKSVPTITRAIKKGRISGNKNPDTLEWEIDPASLFNCYPAKEQALESKGNDTPKMLEDVTPRLDPALQAIVDANKLTIEQLNARIEEKNEVISDYKNRLLETKALTDQRSDEAKAIAQELAEAKKQTHKIIPRRLTLKERIFGAEILEAEKA